MKRLDKIMLWAAILGVFGSLSSSVLALISKDYDLAVAWFCSFCWSGSYLVTLKRS
jgi:hypothetical protein